MHLELWMLITRFRIEYNRTFEGPRPRPILVLRLSSAEQASRVVRHLGVGRVTHGSVLFEGASILPALRWMGCKDLDLLASAAELADHAEAQSPTRLLKPEVERFRDLFEQINTPRG